MNNFDFCSPTRFVFGKDTEKQAGALLKEYGAKKILIHYGGQSAKKSGLLDRVLESVKAANIDYIELGGVEPNPKSGLVYKGIELCKKENVDFLLAVGGGSVIDSAKAIGVGVKYDGDFFDFFAGKAVPEAGLPIGVIVTLPAAGSEGSNSAVITHEETKLKRGLGCQFNRPTFSIMNPELTYTLPAYQTACGIVDIMAHVLERYFSQTEGVGLTDRLCEAVLLTMVQYGPIAIKEPTNYEARANIFWSGMIAHNQIVGLGRAEDWVCHQIEHELSAQYDVAHGAGLAVVIPSYMRYQVKHITPLFAQLAERVFGVPYDRFNPENTALEGINRLEAFFKSIGMPTTFAELGAKEDDIEEMAERAKVRPTDNKMGSFHPVGQDDYKKIYKMCCGK